MEEQQIKIEENYLNKVLNVLNELINEKDNIIHNHKTSINKEKRNMWENLNDYTDEERAVALHNMDTAVEFVNYDINNLEILKKSLTAPYFGKIIFKNEFGETIEYYIGMNGIRRGKETYVFDWRAPISSVYYNFDKGEAYYDAEIGRISGELIDKYQFKIENKRIVRCFNSGIVIDDDYLQEILSSNLNSDKMKNIVSTIQKEQNKIIRNENDRYLIVQGVAGSGKTSVALHRIAYLLYNSRIKNQHISSDNIVIFSPNEIFSDYISDVLPDLGESDVTKITFNDFIKEKLNSNVKLESFNSFLEKNIEKYNINLERKFDYKIIEEIDLFIEEYRNNLSFNNSVLLESNKSIISKDKLNNYLKNRYKNFPIYEALKNISSDLCLEYRLNAKNKRKVYNILISILDLEKEELLYINFLNKNNYKFNSTKNKLGYDDASLYLYFYSKLHNIEKNNYIKHVVIDECQDYSYVQFYLLKLCYPNASFTILGDINQTINPYFKYESVEDIKRIFNDSTFIELSKTYRSSENIVSYSNKILDLNNISAIRDSNNIEVGLEDNYTGIDKSFINTLKSFANKYNRIGIITKNEREAKKLYSTISDIFDVSLINNDIFEINKQITILPSYLSKGLEFDAVLAYSTDSSVYTERDKNLYYVVCTRAQHELKIYNEPNFVKKLTKSS